MKKALLQIFVIALVVCAIQAATQKTETKGLRHQTSDLRPETNKGYLFDLTGALHEVEMKLPAYCLNYLREIPSDGSDMTIVPGPPPEEIGNILNVAVRFKNEPEPLLDKFRKEKLFEKFFEEADAEDKLLTSPTIRAELEQRPGLKEELATKQKVKDFLTDPANIDTMSQYAIWAVTDSLDKRSFREESMIGAGPEREALEVSSEIIAVYVQIILDEACVSAQWDSEEKVPLGLSPQLVSSPLYSIEAHNPEIITALRNAKLLVRQGKLDASVDIINEVVTSVDVGSLEKAPFWLLLAKIRKMQNCNVDQVHALENAAGGDPENLEVRMNLGEKYFCGDKWEKAASMYGAVATSRRVEFEDVLDAAIRNAKSLHKLKRYTEASDAYILLEKLTRSTRSYTLSPEKQKEIQQLGAEAAVMASIMAVLE